MGTPAFFEYQRKETTYHLHKIRDFGRLPYEHEVEAQKWRTLKIPKRGAFRGLRRRPGRPNLVEYHRHFFLGGRNNMRDAKKARVRLERKLAPYRLQLERTLGWGGNGVASLFYLDRRDGTPRDYFVAKCSLDNSRRSINALEREREKQEVGSPPPKKKKKSLVLGE